MILCEILMNAVCVDATVAEMYFLSVRDIEHLKASQDLRAESLHPAEIV